MMELTSFIEGIQQDSSPRNHSLENLDKWHNLLEMVSKDVSNPQLLMNCIIKFLEYSIGIISLIDNNREQIFRSIKYFQTVQNIVLNNNLNEVFIQEVTKAIFENVIEEDSRNWCIKKQLLKIFNSCVENSKKIVRYNTAQSLPTFFLFKMVDSISTYGDYELQATLIEAMFRMYGRHTIHSHLKDLIPESQETSQNFAKITLENFENDVRIFLNHLNKNSGRIFSIPCEVIKLGKIIRRKINSPDDLWIDFNLCNGVISWYCFGDFLECDENAEEFNEIILFATDINNVDILRNNDSPILVQFTLKNPSITEGPKIKSIVKEASTLILIFENNDMGIVLCDHILPKLFGTKLAPDKRTIKSKVSTSIGNEYQPLRTKVCKLGSTSSLLFPTTATTTTTTYSSKKESDDEFVSVRSSLSSEIVGVEDDINRIRDIQILSGRCSGSNINYFNSNSTDTKFKKRKDKAHFEKDYQLHHTSTDKYSTAKEVLTSPGYQKKIIISPEMFDTAVSKPDNNTNATDMYSTANQIIKVSNDHDINEKKNSFPQERPQKFSTDIYSSSLEMKITTENKRLFKKIYSNAYKTKQIKYKKFDNVKVSKWIEETDVDDIEKQMHPAVLQNCQLENIENGGVCNPLKSELDVIQNLSQHELVQNTHVLEKSISNERNVQAPIDFTIHESNQLNTNINTMINHADDNSIHKDSRNFFNTVGKKLKVSKFIKEKEHCSRNNKKADTNNQKQKTKKVSKLASYSEQELQDEKEVEESHQFADSMEVNIGIQNVHDSQIFQKTSVFVKNEKVSEYHKRIEKCIETDEKRGIINDAPKINKVSKVIRSHNSEQFTDSFVVENNKRGIETSKEKQSKYQSVQKVTDIKPKIEKEIKPMRNIENKNIIELDEIELLEDRQGQVQNYLLSEDVQKKDLNKEQFVEIDTIPFQRINLSKDKTGNKIVEEEKKLRGRPVKKTELNQERFVEIDTISFQQINLNKNDVSNKKVKKVKKLGRKPVKKTRLNKEQFVQIDKIPFQRLNPNKDDTGNKEVEKEIKRRGTSKKKVKNFKSNENKEANEENEIEETNQDQYDLTLSQMSHKPEFNTEDVVEVQILNKCDAQNQLKIPSDGLTLTKLNQKNCVDESECFKDNLQAGKLESERNILKDMITLSSDSLVSIDNGNENLENEYTNMYKDEDIQIESNIPEQCNKNQTKAQSSSITSIIEIQLSGNSDNKIGDKHSLESNSDFNYSSKQKGGKRNQKTKKDKVIDNEDEINEKVIVMVQELENVTNNLHSETTQIGETTNCQVVIENNYVENEESLIYDSLERHNKNNGLDKISRNRNGLVEKVVENGTIEIIQKLSGDLEKEERTGLQTKDQVLKMTTNECKIKNGANQYNLKQCFVKLFKDDETENKRSFNIEEEEIANAIVKSNIKIRKDGKSVNFSQQTIVDKVAYPTKKKDNDNNENLIQLNNNIMDQTGKSLNQTLSTTVSSRRKRKLYNPDDLYAFETIEPERELNPISIVSNNNAENIEANELFKNKNYEDSVDEMPEKRMIEIIDLTHQLTRGRGKTKECKLNECVLQTNKKTKNQARFKSQKVEIKKKILKPRLTYQMKETNTCLPKNDPICSKSLYERASKSRFSEVLKSFQRELGYKPYDKKHRKNEKSPKRRTHRLDSVPKAKTDWSESRSKQTIKKKINIISDITIESSKLRKFDDNDNTVKRVDDHQPPKLRRYDENLVTAATEKVNDINANHLNGVIPGSKYIPLVSKPAPFWQSTAVFNGEFILLRSTDYLGKYLVLFFYPLDFTNLCGTEILMLSKKIEEFKTLNTDIVACSVDSHLAHQAWINDFKDEGLENVKIPLLTDLNHCISKNYGVFLDDLGHSLRAFFIIDPEGVIRHLTVYDLDVRSDIDEILRLVKALQ